MVHRESPGATTTLPVTPAAWSVGCGSFASGVALAFAAAGEAARAAHSASTTIVTICAYAHRLSLVIKVLPLT